MFGKDDDASTHAAAETTGAVPDTAQEAAPDTAQEAVPDAGTDVATDAGDGEDKVVGILSFVSATHVVFSFFFFFFFFAFHL
jgi:hypothetical protein